MHKSPLVKLYFLRDPRTGEIRYVGATRMSLPNRLFYHLRDVRRGKKNKRTHWIESMAADGVVPTIELALEVPFDRAYHAEAELIASSARAGHRLLNSRRAGYPNSLGNIEWAARKIAGKERIGRFDAMRDAVPLTKENELIAIRIMDQREEERVLACARVEEAFARWWARRPA